MIGGEYTMSDRGKIMHKICPICGTEFNYMKSTERKFCSRECWKKSKQTGKDIECDNCGKSFHRRQYHIDRQKERGQNNFCSGKCQKEFLHKQTYEIRYCEVCNKEFEVSKLSTQRFCSDQCQNEWQKLNIGLLNPRFKSILTHCTYCGKEHYVKPYKFNEQEHFFCSVECRQLWYAEVFSQSDEWKEFSRQKIIQQLTNGIFNTDTMPQKIINNILSELNIQYKREEPFVYYTVDNYLPLYNLILEIQGDYWHTNPIKFHSNVTQVQYDRIGKDKAKHSYFCNQYGIEILYLWEYDIINNAETCRQLIQEYVNYNGVLKNYHSFNYSIYNNKLLLNKDIIIPYQNMPLEQYKNILSVAV